MAAEYLERMGARMREAREAKGLSQAGLARLLPGTTDGNQVSRWELGKHRPSDDTLEAIALALDITVPHLLADRAEKEGQTPDPFQRGVNNESVAEQLAALWDQIRKNQLMLELIARHLGVEVSAQARAAFEAPSLNEKLWTALQQPDAVDRRAQ